MARSAPRSAASAAAVVVAAAAGFALGGFRDAAASAGRSLLLVPDAGVATSDGRFDDVDDEEILAFDPEAPGVVVPFLEDVNWRSLLGDANANGRLDDVPAQVDAIAVAGPDGGAASAFDLIYSFTTDRPILGGGTLRDGDLARVLPGGAFEVVVSEAALRAALSTTADIDVDAAAFAADGTLLFSLDDAIVTSSAELASSNGGSSAFPDETVFALAPGARAARVAISARDVVLLVGHAIGQPVATVVDLQGLEVESGEIFFTTGIASGPAAGAVFTTRHGGEIATLGGVTLDGSAFGLAAPKDWNGLAIARGNLRPLSLDTPEPDVFRADGPAARVVVRISNGTPLGRARLLATPLLRPLPRPTAEASLGGTGYVFLETGSPMYARSLASPRTSLSLDARGDARVEFALRPSTPAMTLGLQAIDETTRAASHAIVIEIR